MRPGGDYQAEWRRHCALLRERYSPISLAQAVSWIKCGTRFPRHAVVVTVDDGFRDFLTVAYPVLSEFGIPATVYLVSDFLDGRDWLWWSKVEYTVSRSALRVLEFPLSTGALRLPLDSEQQRASAVELVVERLKQIPDSERRQALQEIFRISGVPVPADPPDYYSPLRWDEVRMMSRGGIEFGAHTVTHPILSQVSDDNGLRAEIQECKHRLEQKLQAPVRHFCYPNGDQDARVVREVNRAGFESAVTTVLGLNDLDADLLLLKRIYSDLAQSELYFLQGAAGLRLGN
jgi:peptidoglycan/xylan/chitin deacetylase (PgdA/CDA1 family)